MQTKTKGKQQEKMPMKTYEMTIKIRAECSSDAEELINDFSGKETDIKIVDVKEYMNCMKMCCKNCKKTIILNKQEEKRLMDAIDVLRTKFNNIDLCGLCDYMNILVLLDKYADCCDKPEYYL